MRNVFGILAAVGGTLLMWAAVTGIQLPWFTPQTTGAVGKGVGALAQ